MRKRVAAAVAALTVGVLLSLAGAFARHQNPSGPGQVAAAQPSASGGELVEASPRPPTPQVTGDAAAAADTLQGLQVFEANGCAGCHSVAGAGNPRSPLDGVGARRSLAELRAWTTGADELADSLPPSAFRVKRGYRELPAAELDALVGYLASLREAG